VTGLDTNILVRFFVQDDPVQASKAKAVLSSLKASSRGWVGMPALLELVWVLGSSFHLERDRIAKIIDELLLLDFVIVEQADVVFETLQRYRIGRADFADCLIAASARAAGCTPIRATRRSRHRMKSNPMPK
jgi:predicted nucleic-acid-binding protein